MLTPPATETVTAPNVLSGPTAGVTGSSYTYTTGGSFSSLGHAVEYQFDWNGGGTDLSPWNSSTNQSKAWTASGTYSVRVRARCANDTSVISPWFGSISVTITQTTLSYTVTTSPSGLQITVDGANYVAPRSFNWVPESNHTLSLSSPQSGTSGTRYVFASWSDAGAQNHTMTAPASATTYTARFTTQFSVNTSVSPSESGSATPYGLNWYNSGTNVSISASANSGYSFSNWSGDLSGATNPTSIMVNGPKTVTANFSALVPGSLIIGPSNGLSASGTQGGLFSPSNQTYTLQNAGGTSINWSASKGQNWVSLSSTGGLLAPGASTTVTSSINTNAITLAAGTYGDTVTFTNTTNGSGNTSRFVSLTVNPGSLAITIATYPTGRQISVDGTLYTAPQTFNWTAGSMHTIAVATSPQSGGAGTRYIHASWSDGGAQGHTITVQSSRTTYTANFLTQYSLTTSVNPMGGGVIIPSGTNWYGSGQTVPISATVNPGYSFTGWSGDLSGSTKPSSVIMDSPKTVTANVRQSRRKLK
jgi:uncharacterized repeat protein (TIGR02543 family)